MISPVTVFQARKILTMNPMLPVATHVAVRDGRVLAVGSEDQIGGWSDAVVNRCFADKILMPGLVEGHSHLHEGGLWQFPYVGYFDRYGPDGTLWKGLKSFDEVISRLRDAQAKLIDPQEPLLAWGFDPIYFSGPRLTTRELDRVSDNRSVAVLHASFHLMNVNSAMLTRANISRDTQVDGITRYPNGEPTGELCEFAAMFPVNRAIGNAFRMGGAKKAACGTSPTWRSSRE